MAPPKRPYVLALVRAKYKSLETETVVLTMIVPKQKSMVDGLENVIVSLYAKGMSTSDIEKQIREVYNFDIFTSAILRITDAVMNDIVI